MLLAIIKKRQKMSNKDALLEQAAISAAGLQQSHILGIFALLILVITMFALLGLKRITWSLLLMLNIFLFGYLMKLTVDGSVKETVIGPDGKIVEKEDSDDEDEGDDEGPLSLASTVRERGRRKVRESGTSADCVKCGGAAFRRWRISYAWVECGIVQQIRSDALIVSMLWY